ncbi:ATP-binding protein [Streptomyces aureoverticillatus]|uniref:ATP-binding protein n=1 Tax=Streptomyces aureoverticillatus TaxID=66871 RepID=UPI0013DB9B45|nr:ATP-binding protein [Streptomyces aureoverticillatus]QIB49511.1 AAA family ATPase [Streptomyces aureoverticillatus]
MKTFEGTMQPLDTTIPDPALIVMIGASGSGKTTLARTWPATQVLELDAFRAMVSGCAGDQSATPAAAALLHAALEARLARRLTTVISNTNTEAHVRKGLIDVARAHGVPIVALLVSTPADVCVKRQADRDPARAVPEDVVRRQHADAVAAFPNLRSERFDHVLFADNSHRLEPLLQHASDTRRREMGWDGRGDGLGDLLLVRRTFGAEVLPLWTWRDNSQLAGGDRVGEIRLGPDRLVLALRTNIDGEGDLGFDLLVCCPYDDCDAPAWQPVYSVTDLLIAHTSDRPHPDTACTVHGGPHDVDQEADAHDQDDDPEGRADLAAQHKEAVGA